MRNQTCLAGRLTSPKYQHAIAGLVMARSTRWSLDIREHEFDDTEALGRALCGSTCLVSLNSLTLKDNSTENINRSLQRDRFCFYSVCVRSLLAFYFSFNGFLAVAGEQAVCPVFLEARISKYV